MEHLIGYIEGNVDELVGDLIPALREADGVFKECERLALQEALHESLWYVAQYARSRDFEPLERSFMALQRLWPRSRLFQSAFVRILFGLEDLVTIRAADLYEDPLDFIDALRALRAALREALCTFADRVQERYVTWAARPDKPSTGYTMPMTPTTGAAPGTQRAEVELSREVEARAPAGGEAPPPEIGRWIGRDDELRQLWGRLRTMTEREAAGHHVVALSGASGVGRSALIDRFLEHAQRQTDDAPMVLRASAPRLFSMPRWPVAMLLRDAFDAPLGVAGNADRVTRRLETLADALSSRAKVHRGTLLGAAPFLLRLMGEHADLGGLPSRTLGIRLRRALVTFVETMALAARFRTGVPLFLVFEDAEELDASSWALLIHLLRSVRQAAPLLVLLTYEKSFEPPAVLTRSQAFSEVSVGAFDLGEAEAFIDAVLSPNALDEQTRLRLTVGAKGSPLHLYETVRQLVDDGIVAKVDGTWREVMALPDTGIGDLAAIVQRRRGRLDSTAAEVLEVVAVVEDTTGGAVLEEVAARRAIGREELVEALRELERQGLVTSDVGDLSIVARARHTLIHDEVYRQMGLERRRAIHEDAGEVFLRLSGAQAFPSLAASHLALAGQPTRALHGLLDGVDRSVECHNLHGALDLCGQALGLVEGLAGGDRDLFLFRALRRRAHVYELLGQQEAQARDLEHLTALAENAGTPAERQALGLVAANYAVTVGRGDQAEVALKGLVKATPEGERTWVSAGLGLAVNAWQHRDRAACEASVTRALDKLEGRSEPALRARALYLQARCRAADGQLPIALNRFFEAWRLLRAAGDVYGESVVVHEVALWYWTRGRPLDADRLLRRASGLLREADEPRARPPQHQSHAEHHPALRHNDEANDLYAEVIRAVDKEADRPMHATATIGQGRILVNRGQFDEAMSLLATCLKELGRKWVTHPIYVDALVALAMNFSMFARGEKLVVGGLRYAGEAKERAGKTGHMAGLVRALVIQVRGLVVLERTDEAEARMRELDGAMAAAVAEEPRFERLRSEVELCRYHLRKARGDASGAKGALDVAWAELQAQLEPLRGSGYERKFLSNIFQNREIQMAMGIDDDAAMSIEA